MNVHGKTRLPFGMWNSPLTASAFSQKVSLEDVQWDDNSATLVWLESRSGKGVLLSKTIGEARRELTVDHNVYGSLGYGGGEFSLHNGSLFFSARDGRLYRRSLQIEQPAAITPPFGGCAAPRVSPDGNWLVYVYSDGETDLLALVDSRGRQWPQQLVRGADFYMQPAWSSDGKRLAWVEWDHQHMPWDASRLMLGDLTGLPPVMSKTICLAGGEDTPVFQPEFSPDGRWLSCIVAAGEWENLVLFDLQNGGQRVLVCGEGFMLSQPAWVQGMRTYGWSRSGREVYHLRYRDGQASLWVTSVQDGSSKEMDVSPYTWLTQLSVSPVDDQLALIASAPGLPDRIIRWDGTRWHNECFSQVDVLDENWLPNPQLLEWAAPDGTRVTGWFYAPCNPGCEAEGLPPVLVSIHGGPTSQRQLRFEPEVVYFTTRGYGWLDVNYRGSTGFGRSFQKALFERWGEVDVEDAAGAAQALIDQHMANPARLVIRGGSAGGYTVLNALIRHPGLFKAGVCLYGVSDLFALSMESHKFEIHYTDWLVGELPRAAEKYHAWSPLFHAEKITDPLAIFQGGKDKVVLPNQSEEMVKQLQHRGVPFLYQLYPEEGHGFRSSETIADYLKQVEEFLQKHVLFAP